MLFVTNRQPKQSARTRVGRRFTFDLDSNAACNSVFYCDRVDSGECSEVGSLGFHAALKDSGYRQILVYIHGFSNLPDAVFEATEELQRLCDGEKEHEVLVVPMIWPCDNDRGIVGDYWDDQKAADQSAFSFARVLQKFLAWRGDERHNPASAPCLKRINVLAHSMGNRVLRQTLVAWQKYDLAGGVPQIFRSAFLVAADVVNESLEKGRPGEHICNSARNVVVYYASDDLALRGSKVANLKNSIASRRLGHSGPEDIALAPKNVFAVDCDDVNTAYDMPKGHSYFRSGKTKGQPGVVFSHIFQTLLSGRVFPDDELRRTSILRDG